MLKIIRWSMISQIGKTIFWSGAKQRFCFSGCWSVCNQTARIWALGFLAWWQLTSHAIYYNLSYSRMVGAQNWVPFGHHSWWMPPSLLSLEVLVFSIFKTSSLQINMQVCRGKNTKDRKFNFLSDILSSWCLDNKLFT